MFTLIKTIRHLKMVIDYSFLRHMSRKSNIQHTYQNFIDIDTENEDRKESFLKDIDS